jgi:hypothetical protein
VPRRVYFQCKALESNLDCSSFRRETLPVRQNVLSFLLLGLGPCETENLFSISSPVKMLPFASICPCHNFKKSHQQGFFKSAFGVKFP